MWKKSVSIVYACFIHLFLFIYFYLFFLFIFLFIYFIYLLQLALSIYLPIYFYFLFLYIVFFPLNSNVFFLCLIVCLVFVFNLKQIKYTVLFIEHVHDRKPD